MRLELAVLERLEQVQLAIKSFVFWLIEDKTEQAQVVISPQLWEAKREVLRDGRVILAEGQLGREGKAWTLRAESVSRVA